MSRYYQLIFYLIALSFALWLSFFVSFPSNIPIYTILIACGFLLCARAAKRKMNFNLSFDVFLFLYVLTVTLGLFFSQNLYVAADVYSFFILPILPVFYLFRSEFVSAGNKDVFLVVISGFAGIVALYAVLEFVMRKNALYVYLVANNYYRYYLIQHRAMATQIVPQVLGTYLAVCLPATYHFIFNKEKKITRLLGIICAALILCAILCSGQRVALGAMLIASTVYFFIANKKVLGIFMMLAITGLLLLSLSQKGVLQKISMKGFLSHYPYQYRIARLQLTMKMIKEYPAKGIGLGHYKLVFDRYGHKYVNYYMKTPENMYLMIWCETGGMSLLLFLFFVLSLIKKAFRHILLKLPEYKIALVLTSGLFALLLSMLTYDALYWRTPFYLFWIYCGMLASLLDYGERKCPTN
ncbi:MAG: O-antigen ligase family protein [Candidatus Omnitrophica bacterium]|nr:O-antigen ligase family protein [Candidatus Omnitrophota bacterium]